MLKIPYTYSGEGSSEVECGSLMTLVLDIMKRFPDNGDIQLQCCQVIARIQSLGTMYRDILASGNFRGNDHGMACFIFTNSNFDI